MLAIRVECLTGRYVATAYDDRSRAEWPPHPARLFSALVATWSETDGDPDERAALLFLERCAPPRIAASGEAATARRAVVTHFVPVNDPSVLAEVSLDKLDDAEATRAAATDAKAVAKADAALAKARADHAKRCADVVAVGKSSKEAITSARRVLPEGRNRQPRTFPSVRPEDPAITFVFDEDAGDHREPLDRVCRRLARLGHSASLVAARVIDDPPAGGWIPDDDGRTSLRWVREGQLTQLDRAFELHQATEPRVLPAAFVPYRFGSGEAVDPPMTSVFGDDWVLLQLRPLEARRTLPVTTSVEVASAVRGALMKHAAQPPQHVLTGHAVAGDPSDSAHLAIVPLPDVGHAHADGHLLGVALVLPGAATDAERRHVFDALAGWLATEDGLRLGSAGRFAVAVDVDGDPRKGVETATWVPDEGAVEWASATPIALDRNPGDLLGSAEAQREAHAAAEAIVARACEAIGLPAPSHVSVSFRPPWRGAAKVDRHHPPFPRRADRLRRVQVHVRLVFPSPVRGPVLLGAGRYLGLGLCRPVKPEGASS